MFLQADKESALVSNMLNPDSHRRRQENVQNQINPQHYYAPYFGYNLHLDQNEKVNFLD